MLLTTSLDGNGLIGVTDEFVVTIRAYVTEGFKKVWKVIFVRKELGERASYVAFMDDVVSVDYDADHVTVKSYMDGTFKFYPSESLSLKQLAKVLSILTSEGLPTVQSLPDYEGYDLPPYVEWGVEGNFVDIPLNRAILKKASELLEAKLDLTPAAIMKQTRIPAYLSKPPKKRRKQSLEHNVPVNTTSVPSHDFVDSIYGLLGRYEIGAADYQRALFDLNTRGKAFIALMPKQLPKYTLGDSFEKATRKYIIISGAMAPPEGAAAKGRFFYDLIDTKNNLTRHYQSELPQLFGEVDEEGNMVVEALRWQEDGMALFSIGGLHLRKLITRAQNMRKLIESREFNQGKPPESFGRSDNPDEDAAEKEEKQYFEDNFLDYWLSDQKTRAAAALFLEDIDPNDPLTGSNQSENQLQITQEAYAWSKENDRNLCTICYSGFSAEDEKDEYPVKLKCGHYFHFSCIKQAQRPNFAHDSFGGLKAKDTLKCPNCNQPALDNTFGDGVYRYVNLRF